MRPARRVNCASRLSARPPDGLPCDRPPSIYALGRLQRSHSVRRWLCRHDAVAMPVIGLLRRAWLRAPSLRSRASLRPGARSWWEAEPSASPSGRAVPVPLNARPLSLSSGAGRAAGLCFRVKASARAPTERDDAHNRSSSEGGRHGIHPACGLHRSPAIARDSARLPPRPRGWPLARSRARWSCVRAAHAASKWRSSTERAMFDRRGERLDPYEQRWVMRSVSLDRLQRRGLTVERCA